MKYQNEVYRHILKYHSIRNIRISMRVCVCVCARALSRVRFFVTPCTVSHQAPLFMEFSRQEYWSGLPFPSPGDLTDPRIEATSPVSPALAGRFFTTEQPVKPNKRQDIWS